MTEIDMVAQYQLRQVIVLHALRLGAKQVFAVDIETRPDKTESATHLVVELPTTPENRKAVLHQCNLEITMVGFCPVKDSGQRFVHVNHNPFILISRIQ